MQQLIKRVIIDCIEGLLTRFRLKTLTEIHDHFRLRRAVKCWDRVDCSSSAAPDVACIVLWKSSVNRRAGMTLSNDDDKTFKIRLSSIIYFVSNTHSASVMDQRL